MLSFAVTSALIGYEGDASNASNGSGNWTNSSTINWVPDTDVLVVSNGGDCGADLTGNMGVVNANIQVANAASCGFQAGDALLITDCQTADLFRASSVSTSTGTITIAHATNVNTTNRLSRAYTANATVLRFLQTVYFIGTSSNGNPALFRTDLNGNTEELVDNVSNMQITYGLDANQDGVVEAYRTADAISDWSSVVNAQISLLIRSDDNAIGEAQSVVFDGVSINSGANPDKRLRSIFNSSVSIRNRLP